MAESYRLKVTCSLLASVLEDNVRRFNLNFDGLDVLSDVEVRSTDVDNPDSFEFDISKAPGMYILTMLNVIDSISSTTLLLQDILISNNAGVDFLPLSLNRRNSNGTDIIDPTDTPHPKWIKIIKPNTTFVFNIELPSAEDFSKRYDAKTVAEKIALCDRYIAENRARLNTPEGASDINYSKLIQTKAMWEKFLD
jgi:hypothetical protein